MDLNPAPFRLSHKELVKMMNFIRKGFCQERMFCFWRETATVEKLHQIILSGIHSWILCCSRWRNASLGPYFFTLFWKLIAGSASKATRMGVPAPLSLFLYLKERWWAGGGQLWGKANSEGLNTQSKHYPMFELHTFSTTVLPHTRALPSEFYTPLSRPS